MRKQPFKICVHHPKSVPSVAQYVAELIPFIFRAFSVFRGEIFKPATRNSQPATTLPSSSLNAKPSFSVSSVTSVVKSFSSYRANRPKKSVKSVAAFTLIEILIVVAILGILAAIIYPEYQSAAQKAKESAAKENLRILREAIERYALDHDGVPPGYPLNNVNVTPTSGVLKLTFINSKKYLQSMPKNPFNNLATPLVLDNASVLPNFASQSDVYGWIYKPITKTVKLNWPGTDSDGLSYYDY